MSHRSYLIYVILKITEIQTIGSAYLVQTILVLKDDKALNDIMR
jgi:hypothetical protein